MNWRRRTFIPALAISLPDASPVFAVSCALLLSPVSARTDGPPPLPREFRAAWIASVHNIDWPSKPGLPASQQQRELRRLFDTARRLNLNAVILQVRPACDALYPSSLEPWSYYLTGKMGRGPAPSYDPLEFAVAEAHARGLELHAWFNPFRALASSNVSVHPSHVSKTHPSAVRKYGSYLWLDPTLDFSRKHAVAVVTDVVRRYDVDGVHIDDYFFPYPRKSGGRTVPFDDNASWNAYRAGGGKLKREDWRRSHIDGFVQQLYQSIKTTKPWVKFGVSPFGIWRPGYPRGIEAQLDSYDHLFADSRTWLKRGWLDYLSPQLYWRIDDKPHSFTRLFHWWSSENDRKRHLWPGISTSRLGGREDPGRPPLEILRQIQVSRDGKFPAGHVHWSISALQDNLKGIGPFLREGAYSSPALVPACPWLSKAKPKAPNVSLKGSTLLWEPAPRNIAAWRVITIRAPHPNDSGGKHQWFPLAVLPANNGRHTLEDATRAKASAIGVTSVDRYGNESSPTVIQLQP